MVGAVLAVPVIANAQDGWLLMVPPNTRTPGNWVTDTPMPPFTRDDWKPYEQAVRKQAREDLTAPIAQWRQHRAFDSARACESARREALIENNGPLSDILDEKLKENPEIRWDVLDLAVHVQGDRWRASRCLPASMVPVR